MATTATALYPSTSQFPNTNVYPGQGNLPFLRVYYSTDDASDTDPLWVDATSKVLSFSVSRGRESELSEVDAGTATITLDNRQRTFDPVNNTAIRPMNRWKIYEEFTGETQYIFVGYADSYDQQWPAPVGDAVTVVNCSDEFKVLNLAGLATTDPPRSSYGDLVQTDNPAGYWPLDEDPATLIQPADVASKDPLADMRQISEEVEGWGWAMGGWQ